jgi:N-methylhydantoinase B
MKRKARGPALDPITAEVVRCSLETIADEMGVTMMRTATTPTFSESHDFSTAIFDWRGWMIALAQALPIHMGACKFSVLAALEQFGADGLHDEDIILVNDPYHGGSHIPDWTLISPVFVEGELVLFPVTRAHQDDTGATVPGGYNPMATEIWHEGLRIPPIKICQRGELREDLVKMLEINQRCPTFRGDLQAMIASNRVGARRIRELVARYGKETVKACLDYIVDYTERRIRAEIATWPDGVYHGEAYLEHDCQGTRDIVIRASAEIAGDHLRIDFAGSHPQVRGFVNSSLPNTYSYVFLTLCSMIDDSIPKNEGVFRAVEVLLPPGSVVNPNPPAPCTACTLHAGGEIGEAVAFALAQAVPDKAYPQNIKLGMPIITFGIDSRTGEFYVDQNIDMVGGWCNAAYGVDGWGAIAPFFGAMTMATAELGELLYPSRILSREYTTDSGGPGEWRGLPGTLVEKEMLQPVIANTYVIGTRYPHRGIAGGKAGAPNRLVLNAGSANEMLVQETSFMTPLAAGQRAQFQIGGGGGWGDPLERDPQAVREDVLDEYVSLEGAARDYGVVLDPKTLTVDEKATAELRAGQRRGVEGGR